MQRKVMKLRVHIRDIIHDRSIVLDFLLDGATFRVRSTLHTCFPNVYSITYCINKYHKTSNKCPQHLFEHLTNTPLPRHLIETRRLLETWRLFVSCTNGKYWHLSVREINAYQYTTSFPKTSNLVDGQRHSFLCAYRLSIMLNTANLVFSTVAVRGAHTGPILACPTENTVGH